MALANNITSLNNMVKRNLFGQFIGFPNLGLRTSDDLQPHLQCPENKEKVCQVLYKRGTACCTLSFLKPSIFSLQ